MYYEKKPPVIDFLRFCRAIYMIRSTRGGPNRLQHGSRGQNVLKYRIHICPKMMQNIDFWSRSTQKCFRGTRIEVNSIFPLDTTIIFLQTHTEITKTTSKWRKSVLSQKCHKAWIDELCSILTQSRSLMTTNGPIWSCTLIFHSLTLLFGLGGA